MREMTMTEYMEQKCKFIRKHYGENGYKEHGHVIGETIHKVLVFEDGACWYETTLPVHEVLCGEIHGIKCESVVKLYCTEVWDSDNPDTRKLYER